MLLLPFFSFFFFFNDTATTEIYTLSLPTLFRSLRGAHGSAPAEERHRPAERSADRPQPEARARRAQPDAARHRRHHRHRYLRAHRHGGRRQCGARGRALVHPRRDRVDLRRAVLLRVRLARPHGGRSEEHTSELQSPCNLVCRLLLEKKKKKHIK